MLLPVLEPDLTMYESYRGLVLHAMKAFWHEPRRERTDVLCLLLAEPRLTVPNAARLLGTDQVVRGATGAALLTLLLRSLRGRAGWAIMGATTASLMALYLRHRPQIEQRTLRYRRLLSRYRLDYDEIQRDFGLGQVDEAQRKVLVAGLYERLERALLAQEELSFDRQARPSFAAQNDESGADDQGP